MKKLIITLLLCFAAANVVSCQTSAGAEKVWICDSPRAYAYHSDRYCEGLGRCKSCIKEVTLEEAEKEGKRKPCGYCFGDDDMLAKNDKGVKKDKADGKKKSTKNEKPKKSNKPNKTKKK